MLGIISPKRTMCAHGLSMHLKSARRLNQKEGVSTSTSSNSNRSCQSKTYISKMLGIISPKRTMCAHGLSMQLKFARRLNQKEGVSTSTSSNNNRSCQSKTYISDILGIISPKQVMPRNLRRCPADARRRQGVHPTPWQAAKCCACHEICAGAQPTPDDARAYIRPLGRQQSAAPATKSAPVPSRRQTTPGRTSDPLGSSKVLRLPRNLRRCPADARRRQGVHPTPWQAAKCCTCHEICAGAQPTPDDARAYIRPLGKQQSAAPATKSAPDIRPLGKQQSAAPATKSAPVPSRRQTTPGRTSDPLAGSKVLRLPRNLRRCPADARRRQGVHPTPWQAAKCCACHEICAGAQPTPDDARAYIRPLGLRPLGKSCCVCVLLCVRRCVWDVL